ncbi:oxidoreductase [Natronospirillum operosum]|uniref:Oxidoreductase n=1 Tax=Natronospirillum operosum TaxID=2759953 RepID=A0A4Z0WHR5_9GAMM|nr:Gfo/Idh/MocA family oxidoreductase [Natronospirillum operosum]TGG94150.1 oxidoreductase [Natronospirillum operosum]
MSKLGVGLIGFGLSGQVFHTPFIRSHDQLDLRAVQSRQTEAVQAVAPEVDVVDNAASLMERQDIDLIVITAPNELHFPLSEQALQAGKHVLLEKPSVTRVDEMEALLALADARGLQFSVYQNRRYDGDFLTLRRLVDSAELGPLRHLDTRFDRFRPAVRDRWREQPGIGTGIFWDLGPHLLDQVLVLLGRPKTVQADIRALRPGSQTPDWFEVWLDYGDIQVTAGSTPFEAGDMRRFNARFERGSWQCWGLDPQEAALRDGAMPDRLQIADNGLQQATQFDADGRAEHRTVPAGDYRRFYQALVDSIVQGLPGPVAGDEARDLIKLLVLLEQSAQGGQRLPWTG